MSDCIFCKIVAGTIPARIAYEDEHVLAFHDISPQAPVHVLVIPRRHIATLNDLGPDDATLVGAMTLAAQKLARDLVVDGTGFRLVLNCNADGGQDVFHLHLHLLGGRRMKWPPG